MVGMELGQKRYLKRLLMIFSVSRPNYLLAEEVVKYASIIDGGKLFEDERK